MRSGGVPAHGELLSLEALKHYMRYHEDDQ